MEAENNFEATLIRFLLELVRGNWNAVLPTEAAGTEEAISRPLLDELTRLLGDELRNLILHKAFVNPRAGYRFVENGLLLLDMDFRVVALTRSASEFLELSPVALYRADFVALLEQESARAFHALAAQVKNESQRQPAGLELLFKHPESTLKADVFITPLLYGKPRLAVNLFGLSPVDLLRNEGQENIPSRVGAVQHVYNFILAHRDGPLPSARELARRFGTNEFELKKDFRALFGSSIYQVFMRERLQRAMTLITTTKLSLSSIAMQSGFEDYSSFGKAFRKQYGYSPTTARGTL